MREKSLGFKEHIAGRRGREGEVDYSVEVQALHLKDHAVDRHTKDFGFAELVKVVLKHSRGVEPITVPGASSSGTTCSLRGRSFRNPAHLEGLNSIVQVIPSLRGIDEIDLVFTYPNRSLTSFALPQSTT